MRKIIIRISKGGEIKATVQGAAGTECLDMTKSIENMGLVVSSTPTEEMYIEPPHVEKNYENT